MLMCFCASASSLSTIQDLSFGTLVPIATSGSVTVSLSGVISTNGVVTIAPTGTTYSNGTMKYTATGLSGLLDLQFTPQGPASATLTNSTPGGGTVTITDFSFTPNLTIRLISQPKNFNIGATMNFTSASKPGVYTGTAEISVPSVLGLLGDTARGNLNITLTLWAPLAATEKTELHFGTVETGSTASVVRIAPQNSARSIVSGPARLVSSGSTPVAGSFTVTGKASTPVTITLPSTTTLSSPLSNMNVTNFTQYPAGATQTLDGTGSLTLYVGADLGIVANQPAGAYSGSYNITINY